MDQNNNTIPVAPEVPEVPVAPVIQPSAPAVQSGVPVAPLIQPSAPVEPVMQSSDPAAPAVQTGVPVTSDAFQVEDQTFQSETVAFQPEGLGATDALTMPEVPKAPDPIEEELKAPLKAAGPVPGSIGSAISMPSDGTNPNAVPMAGVRSVSFNDPLMQNAQKNKSATKQQNKNATTYILLSIFLLVIVVIVILMVFVL